MYCLFEEKIVKLDKDLKASELELDYDEPVLDFLICPNTGEQVTLICSTASGGAEAWLFIDVIYGDDRFTLMRAHSNTVKYDEKYAGVLKHSYSNNYLSLVVGETGESHLLYLFNPQTQEVFSLIHLESCASGSIKLRLMAPRCNVFPFLVVIGIRIYLFCEYDQQLFWLAKCPLENTSQMKQISVSHWSNKHWLCLGDKEHLSLFSVNMDAIFKKLKV